MNDYFLQAAAQAHVDDLLDRAARSRRARDARKARRAERRASRDECPATIDMREIAARQELPVICGQ